MSVAPFAVWRPLPPGVNHSAGGMVAYDGVVLHIMEGILDGTDSWFRNPQAQASAHFGVGKDGRIYQWVDTADKAWAQAAGNPRNISIENEGHAGDSLTAAQCERVAEILAWAHTTHGVPLRINDFSAGQGLGWHGMGGAAWGGHTGCPGDPIKAQRAGIIARVQALLYPQPQVHIQSVPQPQPAPPVHYQEDNVTKIPVHIPALDDQGNGNFMVPGVADRVVSVKMNGSDAGGYVPPPRWDSFAIGADEKVKLYGGTPHGELDLTVWVVG